MSSSLFEWELRKSFIYLSHKRAMMKLIIFKNIIVPYLLNFD